MPPGQTDAETIFTGTRAAAVGGYTCVHAMANTSPVADTASVVEQVWRKGKEAGFVDVRPVGAVTEGLEGKHLSRIGGPLTSLLWIPPCVEWWILPLSGPVRRTRPLWGWNCLVR